MISLAIQKLTAIGWNKRILSFQDFENFIDREQVELIRLRLPVCGLYVVVRDQPVIAIDEKLNGNDLNYVAWHEVGHYLLHSPEIQFFTHGTTDKAEAKAHLIAACALIPKPILKRKTFNEIADEFGYAKDLILLRASLYQRFGY